jgi:outer membrane protein TolC
MKISDARFWPLGLLIAVRGFSAAPDTFVDRVLTLEDSVRIAQSQSEGVLSSREDVTIALQRVHQAESLLFPQLDLNANWSKFRVEGDRPFLTQQSLGLTLIPENSRPNYYTTRVDIYQPLYEGGRLRNTWRQARIAYEKSRDIQEGLQAQVTASAKQAFFDLLLAQTRSTLYTNAMAKADALHPSTRGSFAERLRFERSRSDLREAVVQSVLEENVARLDYLRTLNLELNTHIQLSGELKTVPSTIDLQKMLAWASRYRSELRQTEYQQESDALGISLSLAERTPRIGLGATYERSGNDIDLPVANWTGTLNINLPVSFSDMFFGWAKVRERRAQYRQATVKHADAADQVEKQVREAYLTYRYWEDEMDPRAEELKRAQALIDAANQETINAADQLDLLRLRTDAEVRNLQASHGHLWAKAALEKAVGHPLDEK